MRCSTSPSTRALAALAVVALFDTTTEAEVEAGLGDEVVP